MPGDDAADGHFLAVRNALERLRRGRGVALDVGLERGKGMAGDIKPHAFFFIGQELAFLPFRNIGKRGLLLVVHGIEDAELADGLLFLMLAALVDHHVDAVHHLRPAGAGEIEGPALDERFDHAPVHPALVHLFAEVRQGRERALCFPRFDHRLDGGDADVLDRGKAEADGADGAARFDVLPVMRLDHGEVPHALVHIRRQDVDAHLARFVDVLDHLVRVLDFAREQGGHVFDGIVGLEVRGLVGDERVGRAVGLVEPVLRELGHEVEDRFGLLEVDP